MFPFFFMFIQFNHKMILVVFSSVSSTPNSQRAVWFKVEIDVRTAVNTEAWIF